MSREEVEAAAAAVRIKGGSASLAINIKTAIELKYVSADAASADLNAWGAKVALAGGHVKVRSHGMSKEEVAAAAAVARAAGA